MKDIAPELYERIEESFHDYMDNDKRLQMLLKKIEDGSDDYNVAHYYAEAVGKCASRALLKHLKEDTLPDGKLYFNIAERTVKPILQEVVAIISEASTKVQEAYNKTLELNIKAVMPDEVKELLHG